MFDIILIRITVSYVLSRLVSSSRISCKNQQFCDLTIMKRKEPESGMSDAPRSSKSNIHKEISFNHLSAMEEKDYTDTTEGDHVRRKRTELEAEVFMHKTKAHEVVSHLPAEPQLPDVHPYIPQLLDDAIFCGHLVTDLDSIAGAIGAAELYSGTASRASQINSETAFTLQYWGVEQPRPIEELLIEKPDSGVCLVDHQQVSQLNKSIDVDRIVGVIDHHALQNATIVTDKPIYIDIRPWGSMSTIIAHTFMTLQRRPTKSTAGLLLCAILSDTLNLCGPTTTEWDRLMATILVEIAGVSNKYDIYMYTLWM